MSEDNASGREAAESQAARDAEFMRRALTLAREAERSGEVPVGSVVVVGGEVVGTGANGPIGSQDPTAHAEIGALREAARRLGNYRLTGATLYATLEPCPMCAGAMIHARIERLVFGCADPKSGAAVSLYQLTSDPRLNHRIAVTGGVLEPECRELVRAFFARRRAQPEGGGR